MKKQELVFSTQPFDLTTTTSKQFKEYLQTVVPSILGKTSVKFAAKFIGDQRPNKQGQVWVNFDFIKTRKKIVPFLVMLCLLFSKVDDIKILNIDYNNPDPNQIVLEKQIIIPQIALNLLSKSKTVENLSINYSGQQQHEEGINQIFNLIRLKTKNLNKLLINSSKAFTFQSAFNNFPNSSINHLIIPKLSFTQQISNSLLKMNLSQLSYFETSIPLSLSQQLTQIHQKAISSVLQEMQNLQVLKISLTNCYQDEFIQVISKLKYLDTLQFQRNGYGALTQQNLLILLQNNVFLTLVQVDFKQLNDRAKFLYRAIKQRGRICTMQLLSLQAIQHTYKDITIDPYIIVNILQNQKTILL